jgi:hypothetical protein
MGWHGNVKYLNLLVGQQLLIGIINFGYAVPFGYLLGSGHGSAAYSYGIKSALPVGHQVAVRHNKAGANAAYAQAFVDWHAG